MQPHELARLWKTFVAEWQEKNHTMTDEPPFGLFMDWIIKNHTNKNPHTFNVLGEQGEPSDA